MGSGSTALAPTRLADDDNPLVLLTQLHLPPGTTRAVRSTGTATATATATYLQSPDSSWAEIRHTTDRRGRHDTREAGPTGLMRQLEEAAAVYDDLAAGMDRLWRDRQRVGHPRLAPRPRNGPRWPLGTTWAANTGI